MKNIKKMKPLSIFFPISRVDEAERIVEGYAFVNEVVPGEGGIRLRRSAMEAATEDYVRNGTCREIHQPSAAGKPLDVQWDDKGAYLRMKVVDDQAWRKVQEGVYKGFSVGVTPKVMRGSDVTSCEWWDTSLVDRGKDRDAMISVWRSGEVDPNADVDVEVLERASFDEYLADCAPARFRDMALDYLWNSLWDIQWNEGTAEEKEALVRQTCDEFKEFMVGAVATGKLPEILINEEEERALPPAEITRSILEAEVEKTDEVIVARATLEEAVAAQTELPEITRRLEEAQTSISALTIERDETKTELARVQSEHGTAIERVKELEAMPERKPPVRNPQAMERTFGTGANSPDQPRIDALKSELSEITRGKPSSDPDEGLRRSSRIMTIRRELRGLGVEA